MKVKRNLMLLLALIVLVIMLASCCVYERPSLVSTPPTTAFSIGAPTPPVTTTITELIFRGSEESLTIQFDDKGGCKTVTSDMDGELGCKEVRNEFKDFIICISGDTAKKYAHRVNTAINLNTDIKGQLFSSDKIRENFNLDERKDTIFCAPMRYLSEGAVFQFEPNDGKNIRCGSSGGGVYCPR